MSGLNVDIVTPERKVYSGPAVEVRAPGFLGEFGVLPGHTIFLAVLKAGTVVLDTPSGTHRYVVGRGFAEAGPERVVLLTDSCEDPAVIDKADAQASLAKAEEALERAAPGSEEWAAAEAAAELARARLEA